MFAKSVHICSRFSPNCCTFVVECDRNCKTSQNCQNFGFSRGKKYIFQNVVCGKFAVECVSNGIVSQNVSALILRLFWQKKIRKLKLEKLENMMEECFFQKKKRFHLFKSLFKNEKVENMPLVAGRLVK